MDPPPAEVGGGGGERLYIKVAVWSLSEVSDGGTLVHVKIWSRTSLSLPTAPREAEVHRGGGAHGQSGADREGGHLQADSTLGRVPLARGEGEGGGGAPVRLCAQGGRIGSVLPQALPHLAIQVHSGLPGKGRGK